MWTFAPRFHDKYYTIILYYYMKIVDIELAHRHLRTNLLLLSCSLQQPHMFPKLLSLVIIRCLCEHWRLSSLHSYRPFRLSGTRISLLITYYFILPFHLLGPFARSSWADPSIFSMHSWLAVFCLALCCISSYQTCWLKSIQSQMLWLKFYPQSCFTLITNQDLL